MPDLLYLDASAVVKLIVAEDESWALGERLGSDSEVVTSEVTLVEVLRALRWIGLPDAALDRAARVAERMGLMRIDRALLSRAAALDPPELRSIDAIHLASALTLDAALTAFVTYDRRLEAAAVRAGLSVEAPA